MANYFTDRVVEHPGRVQMAPVTGEANQYDMARAEGTVTEAGTPFSADAFNTMLDKYGVFYGTCSTSGGTSTKVVTCTGFALETGATICVKFTNRSTVTGTTKMNVNGTGAIQIRGDSINNSPATNVAGSWLNDDTKLFMYDGTYWQIISPNFITGDQLTSIESILSLSATTGRLYNILNELANRVTPVTATPSITATKGSVVTKNIRRIGKARYLQVSVKNASATAIGANVFEGTIASPDIPSITGNGVAYYGSSAVVFQAASDGSCRARVLGASLAANSEVFISVVYCVD